MNQILSVENKKNKKTKSHGPIEIHKIARFFAIMILIFGLAFIGKGSYAIVMNMNLGNIHNEVEGPTIDLLRNQDNTITVKASHKKELVKIIYQWDDGQESEIAGNGTNAIEGNIDLPFGKHILNIKLVDIQGKETTYQKEYTVDAEKPEMTIGQENGKIKIVAKDMIALSYITCRWDDGEEVRIDSKEDSKAQIEVMIDTPKGKHTLTVVAVNTNNMTTTKTQEVIGAKAPKIEIRQDGARVILSVTDEEAVKVIDFVLNGTTYKIDYSSQPSPKIEWEMPLQQGENRISIKAYNIYDMETTDEAICSYTP